MADTEGVSARRRVDFAAKVDPPSRRVSRFGTQVTTMRPTDPSTTRRRLLRSLGVGAAGAGLGTSVGAADPTAAADSAAQNRQPNTIDPIFGLASAEPNPCGGDADASCFESFPAAVRPDHEVEMHIGLPGLLLALAEQGGLSEPTTTTVNLEAADGDIVARNLHRPDATVEIETPDGTVTRTVAEIAELVTSTVGFHYDPAGIHVNPGDVVLFSAETPDHAVAAYHERHGRQNRVPDSVGPIASPQIPVGGSWRYRFETEGVYDLYCPPHQVFGMVMRVVVSEGDSVPSLSVENTGRPPGEESFLPDILGGLDPNVPSSHAALTAEPLAPENIVQNGTVSWEAVVESHRSS
ncbi:cupredoxin domain-containing protein [Haloarcula rubripromontorii]|uniref:cupredoxin domain-containing protein n=1 Tax=Haloarcula rubripromontorii TaxID=1705562 RepID=UPI00345BB684